MNIRSLASYGEDGFEWNIRENDTTTGGGNNNNTNNHPGGGTGSGSSNQQERPKELPFVGRTTGVIFATVIVGTVGVVAVMKYKQFRDMK